MTEATGGPVFVVGVMGSGTTLMRLVLDSHPNLAIAQETGVARLLLANEWVPFWKFGGEWYGRLGLQPEDLDVELRAFYGGLFERFATERGATRWGDKTPFHTWHIARLSRVFPDAVFIGTVRHPAAVASSLHDRFGYSWEAAIQRWMRSTKELILRGSQLDGRMALCRYEDLVTQPELVVPELISWLNEPWSDEVLSFHEVHRQRGTAREVEGLTRSDRPMDASRIAQWTNSLDADVSRLLRRTAALATLLGYDLEQPMPVAPLGSSSPGGIATGASIEGLITRSSGVTWRSRRPTLENRELRPEDLKSLRRRSANEHPPSWGRRAVRRLPPATRRRLAVLHRRVMGSRRRRP
jgi:hypothetical protein